MNDKKYLKISKKQQEMEKSEIARLKLRRHYFIAPKKLNHGEYFRSVELSGGYYLNYHSDLVYTRISNDTRSLILLGDLFDPFLAKLSNEDILGELANHNFQDILKLCSRYSGRYILIYIEKDELKLLHDFMAHMKVYHTTVNGKTWCASQPHTLAQHLNIRVTEDEERLQYFNSGIPERAEYSDFLNYTVYDKIYHLLPNHYLDLLNGSVHRFWPSEAVISQPLNTVILESSELIRGYIQSASERYKLMIPVTGGHESRVLLAATREISDRCFYYVNKFPHMKADSRDIQIPKLMFKNLGLPYHILEFPEEVDADFAKIYRENNQAPIMRRLPVIYNYYRYFGDYYNISGNGGETIVYNWKTYIDGNTDGKMLAELFSFGDYPFIIKTFDEWLRDLKPLCIQYNVGIPNLFYLEYRIGNWATNFQVHKDMAQDEFYPFNSRMLVMSLFSAPKYYRQIHSRLIYRKIARYLWKEISGYPYNPRFSENIKYYLERLDLWWPFLRIITRKPKTN